MRSLATPVGLLALVLSIGAALRAANDAPQSQDTLVYVGTYTGEKKGKGIYLFRLPAAPGASLAPLGLAAETPSPAFLEVDASRRLLFAVNEVNTFQLKATGSVSAFRIDAAGRLTLINQQPSMGTGPCHVVLDRTGKNLLIANYGSGSVAVIPVAADGRLGEPSSVIQHEGKSVHPQRQTGPHAHCVTLSPDNRFAFVCDLGLDKVMAYRFDAANGKLAAAQPAFTALKPGAGPRHMAFRPDGRFAYVLNEMNSTVTVFACDAGSGKLTELQTASTLPPSFDGRNSTAEIAVHPSGKWLYVSNRGHDSLALFAIDRAKGTLTYSAAQSTGGKTPRHFALLPGAKQLAIGNQNSDTLLLCRIDEATGRLSPAGAPVEVPSPACVVFLPPPDRKK